MPSTKPRYTFTDTGSLSGLLDRAERRWPDLDRKQLLLQLASVGDEALLRDERSRREAVEATAGLLDGVCDRDELRELRADWPA